MLPEGDEGKSLFQQKLEEEQNGIVQLNSILPAGSGSAGTPPKKKSQISAIALFTTTFLLFLFVVALLILSLSVNQQGSINPVLQFFGQNEDTVRSFLIKLVNVSFGFFSVALLISITIGLFLGFSHQSGQKRTAALLFAFVSMGLQFVTVLVWFGMYNYVVSLQAVASQANDDIFLIYQNEKFFAPLPESIESTFNAPIDLQFSAEDIIQYYEQHERVVDAIAWDLGTGTYSDDFSNPLVVRQRFRRAGQHSVRVQITLKSANRKTEEITKSFNFTISGGGLKANKTTGPVPLTVRFDASQIELPEIVKTYEWDFNGDFSPDNITKQPQTEYVFKDIGSHKVTVALVKDTGVENYSIVINTTEQEVGVLVAEITTVPAPTAADADELAVEVGTEIAFSATKSRAIKSSIEKYEWFLPDSEKPVLGENTAFTFDEAGSNSIRLVITDENGQTAEDYMVINVFIDAVPEAIIESDPAAAEGVISGIWPLMVEFDAAASTDANNDIVNYDWDVDGDGETDKSSSRITHEFTQPGSYPVTLSLTDSNGNTASAKVIVKVLEKQLLADIKTDTTNVFWPECEVSLLGSVRGCPESGCDIRSYTWNFGDSDRTEIRNANASVNYQYQQTGEFNVTFTAFPSKGNAVTAKQKIVCNPPTLSACFTSSRSQVNASSPKPISFSSACSRGDVERVEWDFADGRVSFDREVTHTFSEAGEYEVELKVFGSDNTFEKTTKTITVLP